MKDKVNASLVQMEVVSLEPKKNVSRIKEFVEHIFDKGGADLILFPELANTGYVRQLDQDFGREFLKCAEPIPGYTTNVICKLAKKYRTHIVVGLAEIHPRIAGSVYNSAVLIGPRGNLVGIHHKLHIPDEEKHYFYQGSTLEVYRTEIGNIGMAICWDNLFPELPRILALKGMEILCSSYSWGKPTSPHKRVTYIPTRFQCFCMMHAISNRIYAMACNPVGKYNGHDFDGHSAIAGPDGGIIAYADKEGEEEILFAEFTNDHLLEMRAVSPVFRDRRPELYGLLSEPL